MREVLIIILFIFISTTRYKFKPGKRAGVWTNQIIFTFEFSKHAARPALPDAQIYLIDFFNNYEMFRRCKKRESTEKANAQLANMQKSFLQKRPENSKPFFKINNK